MVRDFHRVIGEETKNQFSEKIGRLPNELIACVGGGSNAIGFFFDFLDEPSVRLIGVEAGGKSLSKGSMLPDLKVESLVFFKGAKLGFYKTKTARLIRRTQSQRVSITPRLALSMLITKIKIGLNTDGQTINRLWKHSKYFHPKKESSPPWKHLMD